MKLPSGTTEYTLTNCRCTGKGLVWSAVEFDIAFKGPVLTALFDDEGTATVDTVLRGLAETDFEQDRINQLLTRADSVEDWRVGEAIAESYLEYHRACEFPWPVGRDVRKNGSSLPGADLVGFVSDEKGDRFAFGEVKTSSQDRYPPNVVYGETGFQQQLEDLRDSEVLRDTLIRYLSYRYKAASWRPKFLAAVSRYLKDDSDVNLFGVLIRDVDPDPRDLRMRVDNLGRNCPSNMRIDLLALYLGEDKIEGLGKIAVTTWAARQS